MKPKLPRVLSCSMCLDCPDGKVTVTCFRQRHSTKTVLCIPIQDLHEYGDIQELAERIKERVANGRTVS